MFVELILLDSITSDIYTKPDAKSIAKLQKIIASPSYGKIAHYRTSFAWTVRYSIDFLYLLAEIYYFRPVFQELVGNNFQFTDNLPLYRCESNKLNDSDMQKILLDFTKLDFILL